LDTSQHPVALAFVVGSYYASFFFGAVEISSVPLVFVDLFRAFPELTERSSALHTCNEMMRSIFAVSFVILRVLYWPCVTYTMLYDMRVAASLSDLRGFHVQIGYLLFCAVALTLLQQYWGFKVIRAVIKMIIGDRSERPKED